jgi:hypothetical protein
MMPWSYKELRRLIQIAKHSSSFDEVVNRTGRRPHTVRKAALRLGIKLAKQKANDNRLTRGLKAKGK